MLHVIHGHVGGHERCLAVFLLVLLLCQQAGLGILRGNDIFYFSAAGRKEPCHVLDRLTFGPQTELTVRLEAHWCTGRSSRGAQCPTADQLSYSHVLTCSHSGRRCRTYCPLLIKRKLSLGEEKRTAQVSELVRPGKRREPRSLPTSCYIQRGF